MDSFDGKADWSTDNDILKENAKLWKDYGSLFWPAITINQVTYRGTITPENVLQDLCANLKEKPEVCVNFYKREHIVYQDEVVEGPDTISAELLIFVVLILVGVNVVLILLYRRCVKKEMEDTMGYRVSNAVSQYISVAQSSRDNPTGNSIEMD